jgi:hydrogenase nickel incorporation protein HypA/HybF
MQNYFNYVSKNTIAENAQLVIDRIPIVMACNRCQYSFAIKREEFIDMKCPECENRDCRLISGKEYFVENMEVL